MIRATLPCCGLHGKIIKVSRSGCRYISDSSILTKPSIDEPSNMHLLSSAFSSWLAVIATFFNVPKISVNCKRINSISSSSTMRIISFLVYFAILNLLIIAKSYNLIVLHRTSKQIKSTAYCHIQMVLSKLSDAF